MRAHRHIYAGETQGKIWLELNLHFPHERLSFHRQLPAAAGFCCLPKHTARMLAVQRLRFPFSGSLSLLLSLPLAPRLALLDLLQQRNQKLGAKVGQTLPHFGGSPDARLDKFLGGRGAQFCWFSCAAFFSFAPHPSPLRKLLRLVCWRRASGSGAGVRHAAGWSACLVPQALPASTSRAGRSKGQPRERWSSSGSGPGKNGAEC